MFPQFQLHRYCCTYYFVHTLCISRNNTGFNRVMFAAIYKQKHVFRHTLRKVRNKKL